MLTVISLGGSLVYPKKVDGSFVMGFSKLISEYVKKGHKFAVYCGGGYLARKYQKFFSFLGNKYLLDWIGIFATRRNARLLKKYLKLNVYGKIITDPTKKIDFKEDVLLAAGWKPGWSTDYDSVLLAKNLGAEQVINMTNVDYVYDKDPRNNKDAKPIKAISWLDFKKLVGSEWKPGLNMPFDPIAAKEAERSKLNVILVGKDLGNLRNLLEKKPFNGTVIK
jgi:uridylate kinase